MKLSIIEKIPWISPEFEDEYFEKGDNFYLKYTINKEKLPKAFTLDEISLQQFARAERWVAFVGVCDMKTGKIYLNAVVPRPQQTIENKIGGFGEFLEPHWPTITEPIREQERDLWSKALKELPPIFHEGKDKTTGIRLGTSHEQLAKDAEGSGRGIGAAINIPAHYVGFTVFKGEGTEVWPHKISFKSGTLNNKFMENIPRYTKLIGRGLSAPKKWVDSIHKALQSFLPSAEVQTRPKISNFPDHSISDNMIQGVRKYKLCKLNTSPLHMTHSYYEEGQGTKKTFVISLDLMVSGLKECERELENEKGKNPHSYEAIRNVSSAMEKLLTKWNKKERSRRFFRASDDSATEVLQAPFDELHSQVKYEDYMEKRQKMEGHFERAFATVKTLSVLVIYPDLMQMLFEKSKSEMPVEQRKAFADDHLLFTFALRNMLTRLVFYTTLQTTIHDILRKFVEGTNKDRLEVVHDIFAHDEIGKLKNHLEVEDLDLLLEMEYSWANKGQYPWHNAVAFVGCNRLLSPTNSAGVAISSDIDFKLVFDPSTIKVELEDQDVTEAGKKFVNKLVVALLNTSLKKKTLDFDDARLTLEVEDYTEERTTKDLSLIKEHLKEIEAEKNFLASIYYNNELIAGSKQVYEKFNKIMKERKDETKEAFKNGRQDEKKLPNDFSVAARTFSQYLGESDKGSILAIKHLGEIKTVIDACVEPLFSMIKENKPWAGKRIELWHHLASSGEVGSRHIKIPHVCRNVLTTKTNNGKTYAEELLGKDEIHSGEVKEALSKLQLFDEPQNSVRKLLTVAKLYANFSDSEVTTLAAAEATVRHIGSTLATPLSWRYSLKYAGSRLNDFFDSVPDVEYYIEWWIELDREGEAELVEAKMRYAQSKEIAQAINRFSLSMQTAIYLAASNPRGKEKKEEEKKEESKEEEKKEEERKSHKYIDTLYSRLTNDRYEEILERMLGGDNTFHGLMGQFDKLHDTMLHLINSQGWPPPIYYAIGAVILALKARPTALNLAQNLRAKTNAKALFDALFTLALVTKDHLHPSTRYDAKDEPPVERSDDDGDSNIPSDGISRVFEWTDENQVESYASLKKVYVTGGIVNIPANVFARSVNLTTVLISGTTKTIGNKVFSQCKSLVSVTFMTPSLVDTIRQDAFESCIALRSIALPSSIKVLGEFSFKGCHSLESVKIPPDLTEIQEGTFSYCHHLKEVVFPDDSQLEHIRANAFEYCRNLQSITIPWTVKSIGDGAFQGCKSLRTVTFMMGDTPKPSLLTIGVFAFVGCESLESIRIPKGVATIGDKAFANCANLLSVTMSRSTTLLGKNVFDKLDGKVLEQFYDGVGTV